MKHHHISVGNKLAVLLLASPFLFVLAPPCFSSPSTGHQPGSHNARGQALNRDMPPQLPADRAGAGRLDPEKAAGDTTLSHEEQQRHFRAGDSYVPSDQELHLLYPPGSRRPLWGY